MTAAVEQLRENPIESHIHVFGTDVSDASTSAEAMERAGLGFNVRKEPLIVENPEWRNGDTGAFVTIREDTGAYLGTVRGAYTILQNTDMFAIGDALHEQGARWDAAGVVFGGKRVWALMRIDDDNAVDIGGGDIVKNYVLFSNGHDGRHGCEVMITTTRVRCANQIMWASRRAQSQMNRMTIRHTSGAPDRLNQAAQLLVHARDAVERRMSTFRDLRSHRMTKAAQLQYLTRVLIGDVEADEWTRAQQRKFEVAKACLEWERANNPGTMPGTMWTAFNAVTNYTTWETAAARAEPGSDARIHSQIGSRLARTNERALQLAVAAL